MSPVLFASAVVLFAASAGGWVAYYRWKDRARPEPLWLLLATAAGGGAAILLALLGYGGFEARGIGTDWTDLGGARIGHALAAAARIGSIEELAKLAPVLPVAFLHRKYDELLDGIVYAACSALGFATAESILLLSQGELDVLQVLARAAAAPATHALFAGPWGLGLAYAALERRWWALAAGLGISIAAHGGYDLLLARTEIPQALSTIVVLGLWVWLIWISPRLAKLAPIARDNATRG